MNNELQKQLAEEFPFLRCKQQPDKNKISNLYDAFGMEIDDGWFSLVKDLCTEIKNLYDEAGLPCDIVMDQVKEKYGTLRWYYHYEEDEGGTPALDFPGESSLRFASDKIELKKNVADIVSKYERLSGAVCEVCGRPGKIRSDLGWIRTLCDEHYTKDVNR